MSDRVRISSVESEPNAARVAIEGELDLETVGAVDLTLRDLAADHVELDLGGVTFCDSRGIECIVRHRVARRDEKRDLLLVRRSEPVERVLSAANLHRFFDADPEPRPVAPPDRDG